MQRLVIYLLLFIFAFVDKAPPSLSELAEQHHILWDSHHRTPICIIGQDLYFEPCNADNPDHQALFINLYTDPDTMRFYGTGEVRSPESALQTLNRYAQGWNNGHLYGAFIVRVEGKAVMMVGVGLFQAAGVGEFYIMADRSVRGKGITTDVMDTLKQWCVFLHKSNLPIFKNVVTGKKARLNGVFATASEDNIPSIRVMLKNGFRPLTNLGFLRHGFPREAQLFTAPSDIKGLPNQELSIIYPTRYWKRKAGFYLRVQDLE